jgi:hypothetical protein
MLIAATSSLVARGLYALPALAASYNFYRRIPVFTSTIEALHDKIPGAYKGKTTRALSLVATAATLSQTIGWGMIFSVVVTGGASMLNHIAPEFKGAIAARSLLRATMNLAVFKTVKDLKGKWGEFLGVAFSKRDFAAVAMLVTTTSVAIHIASKHRKAGGERVQQPGVINSSIATCKERAEFVMAPALQYYFKGIANPFYLVAAAGAFFARFLDLKKGEQGKYEGKVSLARAIRDDIVNDGLVSPVLKAWQAGTKRPKIRFGKLIADSSKVVGLGR